MNKAYELFKLMDDHKDIYDLEDILKEIDYLLRISEIDNQEYVIKINEYRKKYMFEMSLLDVRERIIDSLKINRIPISNKNMLINILVSITGIKVLEKMETPYKLEDIKDYDYVINLIKEDRKIKED